MVVGDTHISGSFNCPKITQECSGIPPRRKWHRVPFIYEVLPSKKSHFFGLVVELLRRSRQLVDEDFFLLNLRLLARSLN